MKTLNLSVITPNGSVFDSEVDMVIAETHSGEIGILRDHIPLVATLKISAIQAKKGNQTDYIAISGGFIEVHNNQINVLAQSAELSNHIDLERALLAKSKAEERLRDRQQDTIDFARAELALQRAINRINVVEKHL